MKTCTKCRNEKNECEFFRDKSRADGLCPQCKNCKGAVNAEYHKNNKESVSARQAKYNADHRAEISAKKKIYQSAHRATNRERLRAEAIIYYEANRERISAARAARHKADPEKNNARGSVWRKANPEKNRATITAWGKANPEKIAANHKKWRDANPEKRKSAMSAWRIANPDKVKAYNDRIPKEKSRKSALISYYKNREKRLVYMASWKKDNREKMNSLGAKRRATKMMAIPLWGNQFFIEEIYDLSRRRTKETGIEWHVDHIVPLQSKIVCGLHCEANLQVIPATKNISKGNRHWPDMPVIK